MWRTLCCAKVMGMAQYASFLKTGTNRFVWSNDCHMLGHMSMTYLPEMCHTCELAQA